MEVVSTAKMKLPKKKVFLETMKEYSKAMKQVDVVAQKHKTSNRNQLHKLVYKKIREETVLPSQLTISSINKASETRKSVCKKHGYKKNINYKKYMSIRYDKRSFSLKQEGTIASISTIKGRENIELEIPEYYKKYFDPQQWNYQAAELTLDNKNQLYLNIIFKKNVNQPTYEPTKNTVVGVDLGINKLAVTNKKQFFNNSEVRRKKSSYRYLRQRLQKKGTQAAKRRLRLLSGKEKRFMKTVNHEISKEITKNLLPGDVVVLEDLKHIRQQNHGKKGNYWLNNWSYFELKQFITYKAERKGATVFSSKEITKYSSQECSCCQSRHTKRNRGFFECLDCGYTLDSDLNASKNLARRYMRNHECKAAVSQPMTCDIMNQKLTTN